MNAPRSLVLDLIEYVAREPRSYDDVMGRWRTSCPRLPVWEDALDAGLVRRDTADGRAVVIATPKGLSLLAQERA
jgi:hypothetical protein